MKIFHHRINQSSKLSEISPHDGVEIDLRSKNGRIILQHDPFLEGEDLLSWFEKWQGHDLILNVKEEGLEDKILEILDSFSVKKYFFLDQSFPFLMKTLRFGNRNVAARVSDLESYKTALGLDCQWVWLDCFLGDWEYLIDVVPQLRTQGKSMCLVSPELARLSSKTELFNLQRLMGENNLLIDAVCTKDKSLWEVYEH
jgi:hypothetical protein